MKTAVIGSRSVHIEDLGPYLPEGTDEIVSGGAKGVDLCAREYAIRHGLKLTEFLPDYKRYKRGAPLLRNQEIIGYADAVIAFWDGTSRGTAHVIREAERQGKQVRVISVRDEK